MKIGVLSDTHIPERAAGLPARMVEDLKGVDMIIHAGDLVEAGVLDALKTICPNVVAVWGNMDPEGVKKTLRQKEIIKAGKFKIAVTHGHGSPRNLLEAVAEEFKNDRPDIIIFGHSHAPVNETRNGILFFNPGSATDKVFSQFNSYGIIELNDTIVAKVVKLKEE